MAPPDLEKIKRLQAQATAAKGKYRQKGIGPAISDTHCVKPFVLSTGGGPRRKPVRAAAAGAGDDKKLSAALKKLSVQPIAGM